MAQKFSQYHKTLQKMALTPKMKHSIQLLGMSVADLNDYIETVLASNPFLQKKVSKTKGLATYEHGEMADIKAEEDPREYLLSQIRTLGLDKSESKIAEYLFSELDESGYIKADLEAVAKDLFIDTEKVAGVLEIIQGMDPPGIGASDIKECLQLQLKRSQKEDSLEYAIVTDFLSDLAINDIPKIASSLGVDRDRVRDAVKNIKALNPRPGSSLLGKKSEYIIPDLTATLTDKKVRLELNRETIPRLRLYNPYENKLEIIKDPEAKKFLKENMNAAGDLIDSIKRREETMCRVADYVLNFQKNALANGRKETKTLTITDVAEALGLHISTISRALSNKYIQIDNATVPLKTFLSQGLKKQNGDIVSKASIKNKILDFVKNEDKAAPLSDGAIKLKLEESGVTIKRRTVGKYRESLQILPKHLRKKYREK